MGSKRNDSIEIIKQRWPLVWARLETVGQAPVLEPVSSKPEQMVVVDGIHLGSCYDRRAEAELQARLVPERAGMAWVYGVGGGDLIRVLLERRGIQLLNVVIMNGGLFKESLAYFSHHEWLQEPRINLLLADALDDVRGPFAVVPAALRLADDHSLRLRDQLTLELNSDFLAARFLDNSEYVDQIEDNYPNIIKDGDVATLFDSRRGQTVMVAGAGPTLGDNFARIKEQQSQGGCLIAVDAAIKPLLLEEIIPDIVISIDGHREGILAYYAVDLAKLKESIFVYMPLVHKDVVEQWQGRRLVAYSVSPLYDAIRERVSKGVLFASGSVIHPAIDLAVRMGAGQVELYGADFSFPDGYSHVRGAAFYTEMEDSMVHSWVINGEGEKVMTQNNLKGYLLDTERYIRHYPGVKFINMSPKGARIVGTVYPESP